MLNEAMNVVDALDFDAGDVVMLKELLEPVDVTPRALVIGHTDEERWSSSPTR